MPFKAIEKPTEAHLKCARLVLREHKSFRAAALESGIPKSYASFGEKHARSASKALDMAFHQETMGTIYKGPELKAIAINRLVENVQSGKDLSTRSVELLGRLKEVDMFVRPADQNIGLFVNLAGTEQASEWKEHIPQEAIIDVPETKS